MNEKRLDAVYGAIAGDVIGSVYEWNNIKTKEFQLWKSMCEFTDDTVMTIAVLSGFSKWLGGNKEDEIRDLLVQEMRTIGRKYPECGYGGRFASWLQQEDSSPYNSYGNGSAMRVSAAGALANTKAEAIEYGKLSAEVTHNHEEGIKGAVATSLAIYMARCGASKAEIRLEMNGYYDIEFTLDEIRDSYTFNETCQETVPQAIVAFLESVSFEDSIRNAISIGGDSDTLAAITGSMAASYYGIDGAVKEKVHKHLDDYLNSFII